MFRAIFVTIVTFAYIFITGPPFVVYAMLSGNTDALFAVAVWGAKMALWLTGARVEVVGREKIPTGRTVIFMPNHQSNADGPVLFANLPPVLALAKREFFRVPLLGRAMLLRGFIPVDRKNRERAIQAVEEAARSLQAGNSFLVFPEGTRSPDGRLQSFKKGAFMLALKAGVPIVPISVSGSRNVQRKGSWAMRPGSILVTFHDLVATEGCTLDDRAKIMEKVRDAILSGLTEDERPLLPAADSSQTTSKPGHP